MNIILGASGRVGFGIVQRMVELKLPCRGVVRSQETLFDKAVEVKIADFFNPLALKNALKGGSTVFLLTPENPTSNDILGETEQIIYNFNQAIRQNGIKKIVGLSSVGAHLDAESGNILMSRMLEQGFDDLDSEKIFIRPSYYYSNWLGYWEVINSQGVLPTFFPADLHIAMNSPSDVAKFSAEIIASNQSLNEKKIFELQGPKNYSSLEVAEIFSKLVEKEVNVQPIPKEQWKKSLISAGFTENTSENLMEMTQAVIDGITIPEKPEQVHHLATTLEEYLSQVAKV